MSENLKAFLEVAKADPELCEKLAKMGAEELVATAKERGIELSEEDFTPPVGEMSDADLNGVAGGGMLCPLIGMSRGVDSEDGNRYFCLCIAYGQGGDGRADDANCSCPIGGVGDNDQQWFSKK